MIMNWYNNFWITGDITNKAIQDNADDLFAELKPSFEKVISNIVENYYSNIDDNISFDKLYPNIP